MAEQDGAPGAGQDRPAARFGRRRFLSGSAATAGTFAAAGLLGGGAVADLLGLGRSVRVAVPWSATELQAFQAVLNGLDLDGYTVEVVPLGDDIPAALGAPIPHRPDVVMMPQLGFVRANADQLDPLPDEAARNLPYASVWNSLKDPERGWWLGLPFKMAHESIVWYRRSVFDAYNLKVPERWSEWVAVNETLARVSKGIAPMALAAGDGWTLAQMFDNVLRRCARDAHEGLLCYTTKWTDKGVRKAFRLLGRMWATPDALAGGVNRSLVQQFPDAVAEVFGHGRAACVVAPDFAESVIWQFAHDRNDVAAFPFPYIDGDGVDTVSPSEAPSSRPIVVGGDIAVLPAPASGNAKDLIKRLADPKAPLPWIETYGGFLAANPRTPHGDSGVLGRLADQLADKKSDLALSLHDKLGAPGGRDGLWRVLQDFLVAVAGDRADVSAAAEDAAEQMARLDRWEANGQCR